MTESNYEVWVGIRLDADDWPDTSLETKPVFAPSISVEDDHYYVARIQVTASDTDDAFDTAETETHERLQSLGITTGYTLEIGGNDSIDAEETIIEL